MSFRLALMEARRSGLLRSEPPALPGPPTDVIATDPSWTGWTEKREKWRRGYERATHRHAEAAREASRTLDQVVDALPDREAPGRLTAAVASALGGAATPALAARALLTGRPAANDPALVLVRVSTHEKACPGQVATAARLALHRLDLRSAWHPTDVIVVTTSPEGTTVAAAVSAGQLAAAGTDLPDFGAGVHFVPGTGDVDFVLSASLDAGAKALDKAIDQLVERRALGNRPLAGAMAAFIVPMQLQSAGPLGLPADRSEARTRDRKQFGALRRLCLQHAIKSGTRLRVLKDGERPGDYLLPHVRRLVDPDPNVLRTAWGDGDQLDDYVLPLEVVLPRRTRFELRLPGRSGPLRARVGRVRIHLAIEQSLTLEVLVDIGRPYVDASRDAGWKSLLAHRDRGWSAAAWTDFVAQGRKLFSQFVAEPHEDGAPFLATLALGRRRFTTGFHLMEHTRDDRRPPIVGWLDALLRHSLQPGLGDIEAADLAATIEHRSDYRARVIVGLALQGKAPTKGPAREQLLPLLERLHTAEPFGTGHFYDPAFSLAAIEQARYKRYASLGTHYAASDHAMAFLGFGAYACAPILTKHLPRQYARLALHAFLTLSILEGFSREVALVLEGWKPSLDDTGHQSIETDYRRLMGRFLKFTNLVWLEQMSHQIQGIELYDMLLQASPARREFARIREMLSETERFLAAKHQTAETERTQRQADMWAFLSCVGTAAAAIIAVDQGYASRVMAPVFAAMDRVIDRLPRSLAGCRMPVHAIEEWLFELTIWTVTGLFVLAAILAAPKGGRKRSWRPAAGLVAMVVLPLAAGMADAGTRFPWSGWLAAGVAGVIVAHLLEPNLGVRGGRGRPGRWWVGAVAAGLGTAISVLHATGVVDDRAYLHRVKPELPAREPATTACAGHQRSQ